MSVFIGLDGTQEELSLPKHQTWAFNSSDFDTCVSEYLNLSLEEALHENVEMPFIFATFPSTKDSSWPQRHPGKSTCTLIFAAKWEWYVQFSHLLCYHYD